MGRIDKFINNRSPQKLVVIFFAVVVFSAVASGFLSSLLADSITGEQLSTFIKSSDEGKLSTYGIYEGMPLKLLPIWHRVRFIVFVGIFSAMAGCSLLWLFFSIHEIFKIYDSLEILGSDCIRSVDTVERSINLQGADGECVRRISENIEILAERMSYFNKCLLSEKNYLRNFLNDFSHQIKTSLAIIQLNVDMLSVNVSPKQCEELEDEIQMNIDGMEKLVVQAIKIARLETDMIEYDMQNIRLSETCGRAVKKILPLLREKNINILTDFSAEVFLNHDKGWICEAVENIIKNSADHSECTEIFLKTEENPAMIKLIIRDNGKGIPQRDIPRIFEPFSKKSHDITMRSAGLGLSIAQKIVRSHGGEIVVYSEVGKGTRFEFVFIKS